MDNSQLTQHFVDLKAGQAAMLARLTTIEHAVLGNNQPGLVQKVEALEAHDNKVVGAVGVIGALGVGIWGFLEYIFHFAKGGK